MKTIVKRIAGFAFGLLVATIIFQPERFESLWWHTYSDPSGNFSLEFPSKPEFSDQQMQLDTGGTVVLHMVTATPKETTSYAFTYYNDPRFASKTVEQVLNLTRDGAISRVHGALLDEQRIQVDGHQARDIQARVGENLNVNMRLVADGQRLVFLMVGNPAQKADTKNVQKFFDSLKLFN
jgi:hypothetical protein